MRGASPGRIGVRSPITRRNGRPDPYVWPPRVNGKKSEGNAKCGNKYLAWAFIEAAHFAVRFDAVIKHWYQKKCAKTLAVVAIKAVAHKLARACWHVMKHSEAFNVTKAFG